MAEARRRARRVAFTLLEQGDDLDHVERALHAIGFHPALCHESAQWAYERHRDALEHVTGVHLGGIARSEPIARSRFELAPVLAAACRRVGAPRRPPEARPLACRRRVTSGHGRRRAARSPRRTAARRRPDRGAHRRGHLHRVGHPRLPRAARASGRRTRRPRRPQRRSTTCRTPTIRRDAWQNRASSELWTARAQRRRTARSPSSNTRRNARTRWSPRTSTVCTTRRAVARDRHRDPRQRARGEVPAVRLARPDGRDARPRARRRGRSRVPRVRRHPEVGDDQLRREPRARPT